MKKKKYSLEAHLEHLLVNVCSDTVKASLVKSTDLNCSDCVKFY